MANFLRMLFKEAGEILLPKSTVLAKFNEAGVPITWCRILPSNVMFEKKTVFPPYTPANKVTIVLPLASPEENLANLESSLIKILSEKID